eukprot:5750017-Amphidinium_carterae.1
MIPASVLNTMQKIAKDVLRGAFRVSVFLRAGTESSAPTRPVPSKPMECFCPQLCEHPESCNEKLQNRMHFDAALQCRPPPPWPARHLRNRGRPQGLKCCLFPTAASIRLAPQM